MLFFGLAVGFLALIGVPQLAFMVRRRRLLKREWSEVVASIEPVHLAGIAAIAEMYLHPTKDQLRLEPPVMWQMLGGFEGVQKLASNANAMLELCVIAESWDNNGRLISELIRVDLVQLKKALFQIEMATMFGLLNARGHFALMQIAAHYNLIRLRLLGQYENAHVARLQVLQAQLGA